MKKTTFFLTMAFILCFVVSASAFFHDLNPSFTVKKTGFFSSITKDLKDKGSIPSSKSDSVPSASSATIAPTEYQKVYDIGTSYATWILASSLPSVDTKIQSERDEQNGTVIYNLDRLKLIWDPSTFDLLDASFTYFTNQKPDEDAHQSLLRAMCFFGAFEVGQPTMDEELNYDTHRLYSSTWPICRKMVSCLNDNFLKLTQFEEFPFHTSETTGYTYILSMNKDYDVIVSVKSGFIPSVPVAISNPTVRREAFEYYGLCIKRHLDLVESFGRTFDTPAASFRKNTVMSGMDDSTCLVCTPFGDITLDLKTLEVVSVDELYHIVNAKNEANESRMFTCLAIISALEYSYSDENIDTSNTINSKNNKKEIQTATQKIIDLWLHEELGDNIQNAIRAESTSEKLIYSGNYDYYIRMFTASDGEKMFYINARARK